VAFARALAFPKRRARRKRNDRIGRPAMKTDSAKPRLAQVIGRATVSRLAASRSPSPPSRTSPPIRLAAGTHSDRRPDFPEARSGTRARGVANPSRSPRRAESPHIGRLARRAWASEVNRVARATDAMAAAREAGARLAMAAIDCDAVAASHVARSRGKRAPPITFSQAAKRREANEGGAWDRIVEAILKDDAIDWAGG
jgi:hypothetical protein